jgi:hypothetical protein
MTTLELRRTHKTVVERMRRASEREFAGVSALESAIAVELRTADERMDISGQYSAAPWRHLSGSNVAECGPAPHRISQESLPWVILHRVNLLSWSFHE